MTTTLKLLILAVSAASGGCETRAVDPPPPASPTEIASAAPNALGALAAGTDAAPRPTALSEAPGQQRDSESDADPHQGAGGQFVAEPGDPGLPL
jgi:hypothetical protein